MKTTVANIRDGVPPNSVYIGRPNQYWDGYFGNPYPITPSETRESVLERYRRYFDRRMHTDVEFRYEIEGLKGKVLLCYCKPLACHGDVIAEYLNQ